MGHARYNDIEVGLSNQKGNTPLKNHYMITSFERDEKVLRELDTNGTLSNNYRDGINYSISNLNENNLTKESLKSQEPLLKTQNHTLKTQENPLKTQDLSPLELANAEKLAKLESEQLESEKEFLASHQIFLKEAKGNATNQINKTESLEAITQTKTSKLKMKLVERKKPIIIKTLIFLRLNKAC
ncbi:DUF3519 domain-containing protein [Helicobacter pylori]|uniref:DUF3519 domain-containing protein n=1 Tax=Helicobacter pylori TaxID=210 RepID=UPI00165B7D43|nr:DUF3519 domain-containing protein [Helicobacter pylori]